MTYKDIQTGDKVKPVYFPDNQKNITEGKEYEVIRTYKSEYFNKIKIINDAGQKKWFNDRAYNTYFKKIIDKPSVEHLVHTSLSDLSLADLQTTLDMLIKYDTYHNQLNMQTQIQNEITNRLKEVFPNLRTVWERIQ
jgi:hypothetical protein